METNPIDILSNGKIAADCCSIARILPFNVFDTVFSFFIPFQLPFSIHTVPIPTRFLFFFFFLFLLILNSLMSFINRFQLIAIAIVRREFFFLCFSLCFLPSGNADSCCFCCCCWENTNVASALTSHCIANHLNINNPITPLHIFLFSHLVRLREQVSPSHSLGVGGSDTIILNFMDLILNVGDVVRRRV